MTPRDADSDQRHVHAPAERRRSERQAPHGTRRLSERSLAQLASLQADSRRRSSLLEDLGEAVRRLSGAPTQPAGAGPSLERKFNDLIKRLMDEETLDLEAVKAFVQAWQQEHLNKLDPASALLLYSVADVIPPFLLGHVKKAEACCDDLGRRADDQNGAPHLGRWRGHD